MRTGRCYEDSLDVVVQQALGWQPASVGTVRDGRIRVVMESGGARSTRVVRHRPSKRGRPPRAWMAALSARKRHVWGRPRDVARGRDRQVPDEWRQLSPSGTPFAKLMLRRRRAGDPEEGNLSRALRRGPGARPRIAPPRR